MTRRDKSAVLLLAHGTPASVADVPEFLRYVTGGRPLSPKVIEEVSRRYAAIGKSPLTEITLKQAELLAGRINMPVYVGMRNWHPFISQALQQMQTDGVQHAVVICLAPQNSRTSVGLYRKTIEQNKDPELTFDFVESWHDQPLLIRAFAEKLKSGIGTTELSLSDRTQAGSRMGLSSVPVIFTAHSVPQRTVLDGDPYETQARETASLVAAAAGLKQQEWKFAFQSQGMSGGPWLDPTVEETILELKRAGHNAIFIQPIGFLCDHVEILYDVDIAFKQFAEKQGIRLSRAESLNDSPLLISALEQIVQSRMHAAVGFR